MAGPRSVNNTTITAGLLALPVKLYSLEQPKRTSMRMVGPSGQEVHQVYVDNTGKQFRQNELRKIPRDPGESEEQTAINLAEFRQQQRASLPDTTEIDYAGPMPPAYRMEKTYLLASDTKSAKTYRLLAETLESQQVALFGVHPNKYKAYQCCIWSDNGTLFLTHLCETRAISDMPQTEGGSEASDAERKQALGVISELRKKNNVIPLRRAQ